MLTVHEVTADEILPLRQRVLRPHQQLDELREPDDDAPGSAAFAAFAAVDDDDTGVVVATGTVKRRPPPFPHPSDAPAWQLGAMAVDPEHRGEGLGSAILDAILRHVATHDGGLVWCNARVPAQGFYLRHGFEVVSAPFELPDIGPHVVMTTRR